MNRAERRKAKKAGLPVKKEPVVNIKAADVEKIKQDASKDAANKAFLLMLGLPVMILHDKFGFGPVRCERFTDAVLELYDNGTLYKCVQAHTSQADWTPDAAVSLWSKTSDPAEEWPEWSQPVGAHDAYALGAKVSHNGKHWTSTTANNVWEPGVYGWEEVA